MTKKLLVFALALVLVLIAVAPAVVSARESPSKTPPITRLKVLLTPDPISGIDQPVVSDPGSPAGAWPRANPPNANSWPIMDLVNGTPALTGWIVDHRSIYGSASGNVTGQFTFTYGGIVDTLQAGAIHGIVTLQSLVGVIYLSAKGELDTEVASVYSYPEVYAFWQMANGSPPLPVPVYPFFVAVYMNSLLEGLSDAQLAAMYGTVLPPLPKTLKADFSGTAVIQDGTGVYGAIRGQGTFKPAQNKPLLLTVRPDQHVTAVSGAIELSAYYTTKPLRQPLKTDKEKIKDLISKWSERRD